MTNSGRGESLGRGRFPPQGDAVTEREWLACGDPRAMLALARAHDRPRKLRLFCCALCRSVWHLLVTWGSREGVDVAKRYADGLATEEERATAEYFSEVCCFANYSDLDRPQRDAAYLAEHATYHTLSTAIADADPFPAPAAELVRDIFGNPFRPVAFAPEWRTDTAVALSRTMYDQRDFSAMPILADALQDAGCDNPDILAHCRDTSLTHVRGCWVVDGVLGKA